MNHEQIMKVSPEQQSEMETYQTDAARHFMPGLVFSLVIVFLLGLAVMKVMDPATLPIRQVSVTGDFVHLSPSSLQQRVGAVVRGGFFNVNVDTIQQILLQEPWVREVSVKRIWPDSITVNIWEQTAVARWGSSGLINPQAEIFYPDSSTFPENLPVLSGPENTNQLVMENFTVIRQLLPPTLSLEELSLSERRSWDLKLNAGPVIRLGKVGTLDRLTRVMEFFPLDELAAPGKIEYIDMRYTNGFAVRWNPDSTPDLEKKQETYGKKI